MFIFKDKSTSTHIHHNMCVRIYGKDKPPDLPFRQVYPPRPLELSDRISRNQHGSRTRTPGTDLHSSFRSLRTGLEIGRPGVPGDVSSSLDTDSSRNGTVRSLGRVYFSENNFRTGEPGYDFRPGSYSGYSSHSNPPDPGLRPSCRSGGLKVGVGCRDGS